MREAGDVPKADGIGMVAEYDGDRLGCLSGGTMVEEGATITSTFMRTRSAARSRSWSSLSAQRNSMAIFLPSM
jgi:hypothetical protein